MMHFFRNPEIKHMLILDLIALLAFSVLGFQLGQNCGFLVLGCGAFFLVSHLFITLKRYHKLETLSQELDQMLHHQTPIHFKNYQEGELSILQNELSKMTLRLTEQADALIRDKKYLSDAMADISHQLRSPLTSMHLILSLLKKPDLSKERERSLLMELTQLLSQMDWLVEALLKMSKMDAGTAYLKHVSVPLTLLLEQASEPFLIPFELREQTFQAKFETGREQFIGDLSWSVEAISNILKNCMEHTPAGGTITATCRENTIFTEIIIEDNGPGFSPQDLPHLFERFYKGENSSDQSVGIGLALARMIVSQQNGTLKAENRLEGGARFILKFYK